MASANDPAEWILQQSHNYPLLTAAQEIHYARQVQCWLALKDKPKPTKREQAIIRRGKRAYDAFFLCNIRLVVSVANRYPANASGCLTVDDLVQEGLLGLERAIVKFDPSRGYKFSTYAFNWIRQSINRGITFKARSIRLPYGGTASLKKAKDFMSAYRLQHGTLPPLQLVAEHCGIKQVATLKAYLAHDHAPVSLDQIINNPSNRTESSYLEVIADERDEPGLLDEQEDLVQLLQEQVAQLPMPERAIVQQRYFNTGERTPTFRAIGEAIGISRICAQERHIKALAKLREGLTDHATHRGIPALQCAA